APASRHRVIPLLRPPVRVRLSARNKKTHRVAKSPATFHRLKIENHHRETFPRCVLRSVWADCPRELSRRHGAAFDGEQAEALRGSLIRKGHSHRLRAGTIRCSRRANSESISLPR